MTKNKFNTEIAKKILLTTAGIGVGIGAMVLLAAMPGLGLVAKELIKWYEKENKNKRFRIRKTFYQLRKANLLDCVELPDGSTKIILSEKGSQKILQYKFDDLKIINQKKWDGKWRFVIFDLPKRYTSEREVFRDKLRTLGFHQFQKSVWIHIQPCRNEIDFVVQYLNISPYVCFFEVKDFDPGEEARNLFL